MEISNNAFYETHDLAQATYLVCSGHYCEVSATNRPGRALFKFPRTEQLLSDIAEFAKGGGKVAPAAYEHIRADLIDKARAISGGQQR